MHNVFKPEKRTDERKYCYLYADNHVVVAFDREVKIGSKRESVRYYKVAESIGVRAAFDGRVCFSNSALLIAIAGLPNATINANAPDVKHGSENTQARNIAIGSLWVESSVGYFGVQSVDGLNASYDVDARSEAFAEHTERCHHDPVVNVYRREPTEERAA